MKRPAVLLAVVLLLLSFATISYRVIRLRYPVFPAAPKKVWRLSIDAHVKGDEKETKVMIGVPHTQKEQMVAEERIRSGILSFNLLREGPNQIGVWEGTPGKEGETIGYSTTIQVQPLRPTKTKTPRPTLQPYPSSVGKEEQALAKRLVAKWDRLPPEDRIRRIAAAVKAIWGTPPPDDQDIQNWLGLHDKYDRVTVFLLLLRAADLPARVVQGLQLTESITNSPLTWIEIWTDQGWESLQPETGEIYQKPAPLLPLTTDGLPAVRVINGELSEIRWTLTREIISQWRMHFERMMSSNRLPRSLVTLSPATRVSEEPSAFSFWFRSVL